MKTFMRTYLISYDLRQPGRNYDELYEAIKAVGSWWSCLESVWIVKSEFSAIQIRDHLTPKIDRNDKLLIAELTGQAAWFGFNDQCSSWLRNNL